MSYLNPLRATTRSVAILVSPRLARHAALQSKTNHCFHWGRSYAINIQRQHKAGSFFYQCQQYSTSLEKVSDPLHILFCGSDDFSCASLKALHQEHVQNPNLIQSIDVVVRPGKRVGRGYKIVRDPPLRSLADTLGLQIHERDTFTGWNMPTKTNLIIAVSFGLFVPPRLLHAAKYGGLNLHPSLLPDLHGPAPLHHTLLTGRRVTGVSLQTLDDEAFDHGLVLAQTPAGALPIPPSCRTVADLQALVTPPAVEMLIRGLRTGLHVPPLHHESRTPSAAKRASLVHAPKITKADKRLSLPILQICDGETSDADLDSSLTTRGTLARRQDAIGPLWFFSRDRQGKKKRIIIDSLEEIPGLSLTNRPSMIAGTSSDPTHLQAQPPSTTPTTPEDSTSSHRQYLIPFEDDLQEGEQNQNPPQNTGMNLVFWDIADPSHPTAGRIPGQPARGENEALYLGNYRILSLKVEGDKAKPARLALHSFIIN